jgi:hypothetical protein
MRDRLMRFFLLSYCAIEQWLAYYWWYAYHTLRNPVLENSVEVRTRKKEDE